MRRGYVDFTAEFAENVDLVTMMPRSWRVIGSIASDIPKCIRLVFQNYAIDDGPPVRLDVTVHDTDFSRTIAVKMHDLEDGPTARAIMNMSSGERLPAYSLENPET